MILSLNNKKYFLILTVFLITMIVGLSMVSATDNTTTSTSATNSTTSHVLTSTENSINENTLSSHDNSNNNTQKNNNDNNLKYQNTRNSIKSNQIINTWDDLKNCIQENGTYSLSKDIEANSTLTTNRGVNATITGNGYKVTFTKDGLINITNGSTLNIANIILDGNNTSRTTDGIINNGMLTVHNSTVKNFFYNESYCEGGAIYDTGSNSLFVNNTFINNKAYYGGAIYNNATNSMFIANTFRDNNAKYGGAIYNNATNSMFIVNTFRDNNAKYGGAVCNNLTKSTFIGNNFTDNNATYGGAIEDLCSEKSIFTYNYFINNTAMNFGGAVDTDKSNNFTFENNTFIGNNASYGGAVENWCSEDFTFKNNTFIGNNAEDGCTICNDEILNALFVNNTFMSNYASFYGVLYNKAINSTFTGNHFIGNNASYGGAIYNDNTTNSSFNNNYFTDNNATYGGAIYNNITNSKYINNNFTNNTAEYGGVIYNEENSTSTFENNTFTSNYVNSTGGVIYDCGNNTIYKYNIFDSNNVANGDGVIYNAGFNSLYVNNTFTNNNATYANGAAINSGVNSTFINNTVINCKSGSIGAISSGSNSTYINNLFKENKGSGGTICSGDNTNYTNNTFINNTSIFGGAIYNYGDNSNLINNTFTNNTAQYGGAVFNIGCNCTLINNTFIENSASSDGAAIDSNIANCVIKGNIFNSNIVTYNNNGETLCLSGNNTLLDNTYFNNSIGLITNNLTSDKDTYIYSDNVTINGNIALAKPTYYDADILDNVNYTLYMIGQNNNYTFTQIGNSTFTNNTIPVDTYTAYETLNTNITNKNYTTNNVTFIVNKQPTNSSININNITYGDVLNISGCAHNLSTGTIYILVGNDDEISEKHIILNNTCDWTVSFDNVLFDAGKYNLIVYYEGDSNHEEFINTTEITVNKRGVNNTIYVEYNTYPSLVLNGTVTNITNEKLTVAISSKFGFMVASNDSVIIDKNGNWNVRFDNIDAANYTLIIKYDGDTNYEAFTDTTTVTVNKQATNSTIELTNVTYPDVVVVKGELANITNTSVILTIYNNNESHSKKLKIENTTSWMAKFNNILVNPGEYKVEVYCVGDSNHEAFINTTTFFVKNNVIISSTNMTGKLGDIITINATVQDTSGNKVNTGKAVVKINDKTFGRVNVTNGLISYKLNLTPYIFGKYNYKVTFVYGENNQYNAARNNTILTVTGYKSVIDVEATNNTYAGDTITVTVNITNGTGYGSRSGNVGIKINGITYKVDGKAVIMQVANATATFKIKATSKMVGNNNITVTYSGNSQFYEARTTITDAFTVLNQSTVNCVVNPVNGTLGQNVTLSANFTTNDEKIVDGQKVVVKINGVTYGYTTVINGTATFTQYLNPNLFGGYNYKITFKMEGSGQYTSASGNGVLTVTKYNPKFIYTTTTAKVGTTANITVKIANNDTTFDAKSGNIGLKINDITYKVNKTAYIQKMINGTATFNIPITENMKENNNITFTYSGNSQFNSGKTTINDGLIIKA